jgi:hypothetical protein
MPLKLSTTIGKIQQIPNTKNIEIIDESLEYMRSMVLQNIIKITI